MAKPLLMHVRCWRFTIAALIPEVTPTIGDMNDVWFEFRKRFEKFFA